MDNKVWGKSANFLLIYTLEIKISETDIWYEFQALFQKSYKKPFKEF